jgi:hypothetical protein
VNQHVQPKPDHEHKQNGNYQQGKHDEYGRECLKGRLKSNVKS